MFKFHVWDNVVIKNLRHGVPEICAFLCSHTRREAANFRFYYTVVVSVSETHVGDDIFSVHDYFSRKNLRSGGVQPTGFKTLPSSRLRTLPVSLSILAKLVFITSFHAPSPSAPME